MEFLNKNHYELFDKVKKLLANTNLQYKEKKKHIFLGFDFIIGKLEVSMIIGNYTIYNTDNEVELLINDEVERYSPEDAIKKLKILESMKEY